MRKRHTYEYVKQYFESFNYKLISTEYINAHEYLTIQCPKGHVFDMTWNKFQSGRRCKICMKETTSKAKRKPIKNIIKLFTDENYIILEGLDNYKNNQSPLLVRCPIGHTYKTTYNIFSSGSRCPKCARLLPYTFDEVYKMFEERGYLLLDDKYVNAGTKMKYICLKHPNKIRYIKLANFNRGQGCKECANEIIREKSKKYTIDELRKIFSDKNYTLLSNDYKDFKSKLQYICNYHPEEGIQETNLFSVVYSTHSCKCCKSESRKGENNPLWKGNASERVKIMRNKEYKEWREQVFKRDDYTCQCCGKRGVKLNAHHKFNFSTNEDLRFDINNGITLCIDCHKDFHSSYGIKNNSAVQIKEFINYYIFRRCPNLSNKYLNLSTLKKFDNQFKNTREVILSNSYAIQIDLHFRQSVIEEVFDKLLEIQNIINQDKEDKSLTNFPVEKYSLLLLILNFTSLKNIKPKSINEELEIMRMLIDLDLFKEIIDRIEQEVPEELKKFNIKLLEIMQEKLTSLQQQQEFYDVLNKEIGLGQSDKVEKDEEVDNIEQQEQGQQEGDEFGLVGTTTIGNTSEITELN